MKCKCCNGSGKARDHVREGAELKKLRRSEGLSLRAAAKQLGISASLLHKMESGERAISLPMRGNTENLFSDQAHA